MRILVAYATRYGATEAIAARIAEQLRGVGHDAEIRSVEATGDLAAYDVFVIGSAAYLGHWQKKATEFVHANQGTLASRPTWLFSSGPLGTGPTNAQGVDQRVASEPSEIPELEEAIHPRDHRVFYGALDPSRLGVRDRAIRALPAGRALLPAGDYRNWHDIETWAQGIAHDLALLPGATPGHTRLPEEP